MKRGKRYIILLGAPGAGKGTQAVTLAQSLGLAQVASGDLFREAQKKGSELGKLAQSYMEKGLLVPDEVTVKMVLERLQARDASRGAILDGFPRTLEQARALEEALGRDGGGTDRVLYIEVSTEELVRRLSGRFICRQCQRPYNLESAPPRVKGRCDACGGELYQRTDDSPETARKRLEVYFTQTQPLIEHYRKTGKLVTVKGEGGVAEVGQALVQALKV